MPPVHHRHRLAGHRLEAFVLLLAGVLVFSGLVADARGFTASVTVPGVCNEGCEVLNVAAAGVLPDTGTDVAPALNALLQGHPKNAMLMFPRGRYILGSAVRQDNLDNVLLQGEEGTVLEKSKDFQDEYMFYTRFSRNVAVSNLAFHGLTTDRKQYQWGESGLYFGSNNGILVENSRFQDFGDAAIRITSSQEGAKGVQSHDAVVRNNRFDNVTQVTTTSNANDFGGANAILVLNNTFRNLKGSLKFATRTAGAAQVIAEGNDIQGVPGLVTSVGIEVVSYSNAFIEKNRIADTGGFAMNIYTNGAPGITGFDWGNLLVRGNTIRHCAKGIRVSANAYRNGHVPKVHDIHIIGNIIDVAAEKPVQVVNGTIRNAEVRGNRRG